MSLPCRFCPRTLWFIHGCNSLCKYLYLHPTTSIRINQTFLAFPWHLQVATEHSLSACTKQGWYTLVSWWLF